MRPTNSLALASFIEFTFDSKTRLTFNWLAIKYCILLCVANQRKKMASSMSRLLAVDSFIVSALFPKGWF